MKPLRINLSKATPVARALMIGRGAPRHGMRLSLDLDESCVLPSTHERRRVIPPAMQIAGFRRSWDEPRGTWLSIIGSDSSEDAATAAALGLMWQAVIRHAQNPGSVARPFYWPLFGGSFDRLRDREEFRSGIGAIGLLVLSNLAENSSRDKVEKCRDILTMHADVPRVVTVAGCDPLVFAIEQLHMTPTRVLYLGRRKTVRQI